ncbi:MAG: hypothetical protein OHK93_003754 [Ramalina farinacea]|uniref:PLD phosphodiesterase domain-containing protein n=1 Tax=Ramalina farinacea TaxID=258253 RepID=A0AA43U065_9LECA|nr:hypothetical protein [Ramalina farinacea]
MADADDSDMARAIALSLGQEDPILKTGQEIIDLDADNEQTPPYRKTPSQPHPSTTSHNDEARKSGVYRDTNDPSTYTPGILGMAGLDRKKMEEERLARKRKATDPAPASPPTKKNVKASSITTSPDQAAPVDMPSSSHPAILQYPYGIVKKTWVAGHPRAGDDIKLEEVLQAEDLDVALLSSFQWDLPWVLSKLRPETQVGLVMQAKDENAKDRARAAVSSMENRTIQFCFPSMDGQINCMHSKLTLLSHVNYLRIVIPTANLVKYDWGETGTMENSVFLIDLPRFYPRQRVDEEDLLPFAKDLTRFLTAQSLPASIIGSLRLFDFAATRPYAFVHTIGGAHLGSTAYNTTGWPSLATAINRLGLNTTAPISVDFITSSVGSLNMDFLTRIYAACQGRKASSPSSSSSSSNPDERQVKQRFRLYFPTHATVRSSTARSAGTICMQRSYWTTDRFPKSVMRDCQSVRPGCLMHNKIIFVRPDGDEGGKKAWAYVGSANCSESAWGNKLVKDKVTKGMKLNARNWECGVVVPVVLERQEEEGDGEETVKRGNGLEVFEGRVPVPMVWPGREYGERMPWFFMEEG